MNGAELKNRVEAASLRAWPALEEEALDGWTLRHSEGFTGRANSVQALAGSDRPLAERVSYCEGWYEARGRPCLFRLSDLSEPGLDAHLGDRGYRRFSRTLVLLRQALTLATRMPDVELREAPLHEWLGEYARLTGVPAAPAPMSRIIRISQGRALLATLRTGRPSRVVATGLAVLDGPFLGLFDLVVGAEVRRRGFGSELVRRLVSWGFRGGAAHVYLQVTEDNNAAIGLYERLGFSLAYDYWYRIRPPATP